MSFRQQLQHVELAIGQTVDAGKALAPRSHGVFRPPILLGRAGSERGGRLLGGGVRVAQPSGSGGGKGG